MYCLGDRAYGEQFCAAGRKLAVRLLQLRATLLCEPGYGDDCTPNGGVFRDLDTWINDTLLTVLEANGKLLVEPESGAFSYNNNDKTCAASTTEANVIVTVNHSQSSQSPQPPQPQPPSRNNTQSRLPVVDEWQATAYSEHYQAFFQQLCPLTAYNFSSSKANSNNAFGDAGTWSPSSLLLAKVDVNQRLTDSNWIQNTRHVELTVQYPIHGQKETNNSNLPYRAGDVAVIMPSNTMINVQRFLDTLPEAIRVVADQELSIQPTSESTTITTWPKQCTLRGWLAHCADIHALPEREDLRALAAYCSTEHEQGIEQADKLVALSETPGAALYADYVLREKRSWAEVMHDFDSLRAPGSKLTLQALFELLQPMRPREFSIASSPLEVCSRFKQGDDNDDDGLGHSCEYIARLHLCVAVVEGTTPLGRRYHGLCSNYLSQLQPQESIVRLWIRPGSFGHMPLTLSKNDNRLFFDIPLLCIGAGTGIAPLRGLLREREATRKALALAISSKDISQTSDSLLEPTECDNILLFGSRKRQCDFYYKEEWAELSEAGRLSLLTAFSQDQDHKVYVQQRLQQVDKDVSLIVNHIIVKKGAVYIAGGPKMARAIKDVLIESLAHLLGSTQQAKKLLSNLQRSGYFSIEAWS